MAVISFFSSRSSLPPPFSSTCRHSPFFRGAAHFGQFAFRSALLYRALTAGEQNEGRTGNPEEDDPPRSGANLWFKGNPFGISFAIGSFFALADELHQSFVPHRGFELADVAVHIAGIAVALIVVGGWPLLWRHERG